MAKSMIIIGAGMGGLAAGIYGQKNGFETRIFEMHYLPGGQCASWKNNGYTFDVCVHHLMGCLPGTKIHQIWSEIGVMPRELAYTNEYVSVVAPDGKILHEYYDLERLERHLKELAPQDSKVIDEYCQGIKTFTQSDITGKLTMGDIPDILKQTPTLLKTMKWFKPTMGEFAKRFSNPFLQKAFPLLEYGNPSRTLAVHFAKIACGYVKDIAWPVGASGGFASSIAVRYEELGGKIHYRRKVTKIITRNGRAVGVKFEDGSEEFADIIISNADGRKTLLEMLEGKYLDAKLKGYCAEHEDRYIKWAVHVFLGVARDLSQETSSLIMLLEQPVTIAGHETEFLEMQIYGFDKTMAPEGKGVIKVELKSKYSFWKELAQDPSCYEAEKQRVAEQVIGLLENYFHGIKSQVEVVDVPTLLTWERFMGGTKGFLNYPIKNENQIASLFFNKVNTAPGLDNFYFVGSWASSVPALFSNALSGRKTIQQICRKEGRTFSA